MPTKRIFRNQREKVIAGVCAGIADYFDIDVAWVRLGFVLAVFAKGFGLLAYVIAWIVFPRDERTRAQIESDRAARAVAAPQEAPRTRGLSSGSRNAVGIILILLGALFFMDQNFYWFRFDSFWPLILVALGLYLIVRAVQPEPEPETLAAHAAPATGGEGGGPQGEESGRA